MERVDVVLLAGEKPAVCDWPGCTFACADSSNLRRHQLTHTPHLRPHVCPYTGCGYSAQNSTTLKDHTKRHQKRGFVCVSEGCSYAGCAIPGPSLACGGLANLPYRRKQKDEERSCFAQEALREENVRRKIGRTTL